MRGTQGGRRDRRGEVRRHDLGSRRVGTGSSDCRHTKTGLGLRQETNQKWVVTCTRSPCPDTTDTLQILDSRLPHRIGTVSALWVLYLLTYFFVSESLPLSEQVSVSRPLTTFLPSLGDRPPGEGNGVVEVFLTEWR